MFILDLLIQVLGWLRGYVNGGSTFPQPLSPSEESKYISLWEKGDVEARNILIERNLRLVAHIVKKFDVEQCDVEDLISIGVIGLIKGINTFKRGQGTRLATYAARCIENEILMYLRSVKKNRNEVGLYEPVGVDKEGNEVALIDVLGSEPDVILEEVENRLERERLLERVEKLNDKERRVLTLRYGLNGGKRKTQWEIARLLGISRSYVSRIEKRAVQNVGNMLSTARR
ncbi:MAG TPA: RNA polymerase sporulation sigma factor SigK [Firmicutes bacterium]|nr:RNA polymerase sporulation sigma factor SigK [Bacillota bacterium]